MQIRLYMTVFPNEYFKGRAYEIKYILLYILTRNFTKSGEVYSD